MSKIIIEIEELPLLSEAGDFFKLVAEAYETDCHKGSFEYCFGKVKWRIE